MPDPLIHANLTLVTPPSSSVEPVTLDDAKHHLRVTVEDENERIEALIQAAREHLDGRDGYLGRALITQTWEYTLRQFPAERYISLPLPPVRSIVSIKYRDGAGTLQTFDAANYSLSPDRDWRPQVRLAYGAIWPGTRDEPDAVVIQTTNGYGAAAEDVPMPIRQALLLLIGHWYQNREAVLTGTISKEIEFAVEALLAPFAVTTF